MALLDKLFGKKKTLSQLSKSELRKEEIIIGKQRDRLFKRIEDIANAKDMVRIAAWIEDDAVTQDMYQERLDQILELGAQADKDALAQAGLTSAGQELIHLWDQMDKGHLKEDEALEEAEKTIRRK